MKIRDTDIEQKQTSRKLPVTITADIIRKLHNMAQRGFSGDAGPLQKIVGIFKQFPRINRESPR